MGGGKGADSSSKTEQTTDTKNLNLQGTTGVTIQSTGEGAVTVDAIPEEAFTFVADVTTKALKLIETNTKAQFDKSLEFVKDVNDSQTEFFQTNLKPDEGEGTKIIMIAAALAAVIVIVVAFKK